MFTLEQAAEAVELGKRVKRIDYELSFKLAVRSHYLFCLPGTGGEIGWEIPPETTVRLWRERERILNDERAGLLRRAAQLNLNLGA